MVSPMRTVSFKLSGQLDDALSDLARRRNSTRSALVREALQALATGANHSVTAMVGDLVGSLDGPPDLSSNPRHLAGYGK